MTETTVTFDAIDAIDAAFNGHRVEMIDEWGRSSPLPVDRWLTIGADDHELFVSACDGLTIDVGCGPGRLTEGLAVHGVAAVGIDVSAEAVRRTRDRGAAAQRLDVFAPVPGAGKWDHALLADGNIGIGGDPVLLLRRVGQLISATGTILVEVLPPGGGLTSDNYRFRLDDFETAPFAWSRVGADAIGMVARHAGLRVEDLRYAAGRYVAVLSHQETPPR